MAGSWSDLGPSESAESPTSGALNSPPLSCANPSVEPPPSRSPLKLKPPQEKSKPRETKESDLVGDTHEALPTSLHPEETTRNTNLPKHVGETLKAMIPNLLCLIPLAAAFVGCATSGLPQGTRLVGGGLLVS